MEEEWDVVDNKLQFIHRNLDICCQDLCDGQNAKFELEEVLEILANIREKYDKRAKQSRSKE